TDATFRRMAIDSQAQIEIARFFASKLRAATLYALFIRTGDTQAHARALERYRAAREAWARLVAQTNGRFVDDVTFGPGWYQRGHWRDRRAAIDKDIALMEQAPQQAQAGATAADWPPRRDLIDAALGRPTRPRLSARHTPPASFQRGQPLPIDLVVSA